ncbi:hypothetical protein GCM10022280_25960 [Sphingomonas swuensis]|uniref:Uncharacterized protein n=1 Tax=Sphingomonas swuensis TaxID=977800 RepID=A0ABP7TCP6_9SPHN
MNALLIALQLAGAVPTPTPEAKTAVNAEEAFSQLKAMVGEWRPADDPASPLRIRFYLTARGSVLVESWEARGKPHSLTLYHRDGAALIATHYCPQGNQPRLALHGRDKNGLHFALRDITDLDAATESHQHDLWIDPAGPKGPTRSEIYASKAGAGEVERMRLVRTQDK